MRPSTELSLTRAVAGLTPTVLSSEDFSSRERPPSWSSSNDLRRARARLVVTQAVRGEGEAWPEREERSLREKESPDHLERKVFLATLATEQCSACEEFQQICLSQESQCWEAGDTTLSSSWSFSFPWRQMSVRGTV